MPVIRTKKVMDQGAEEILVVGTSLSKEMYRNWLYPVIME